MSVPHHPPGPATWRLRTTTLPLPAGTGDRRPLVMGIVNVTPDSFSDGGRHLDPGAAVAHGLRLVAEGADMLDVGGESTRPFAEPVDADEEWRRVGEVVRRLAAEGGVPVSIDTSKAAVARRALDAGAEIVNDVAGVPVSDISAEKSFTDDLDIDSLSMVEVVMAAEDKWGVKIPDDAVKNLKTVGDAVDFIENAQG